MKEKADILEKIQRLTAIPVISSKALQILRCPDTSVAQAVECFQYDTGLTANLLKLANSSLFPSRKEVKTLHDAIAKIGFQKTLQLLFSISFSTILKQPLHGYDLPSEMLWSSAVSGAVFSEVITDTLNINAHSSLFTCCILRDIGKVLLDDAIEVDAREIVKYANSTGVSFEAAEQRILGIDHCEAGVLLLENWHMPREFIEVVRWHHRPRAYTGFPAIEQLVNLVHIADIFSSIIGDNFGLDGLDYKLDNEVARLFQINFDSVDTIIYNYEKKIQDLKNTGII